MIVDFWLHRDGHGGCGHGHGNGEDDGKEKNVSKGD
jgi:hypothetical protein